MKSSDFLGSVQHHKDSYNFVISEISSKIPVQMGYSTAGCKTECKEPAWKCRYALVLIGFLVFFYINGYRLNTSVTLVAMVNNTALTEKAGVKSQSCPSLISNITADHHFSEVKKDGEFIWSPKVQGYVLSSYYIGYVVVQIPAGVLVERFGSKWFLFTTSFITGVLTMIIPPLSRINVWAFVAVNAVRGIAQGGIMSSVSVLSANWFPKTERGFLYTIVVSGSSIGSFLTSVFSGLLCEYVGWTSSFYTFGGTGIALSIFVLFLVYENPNVHPRISKAERDFILDNQECVLAQRRPNVPWRKILTSLPVFALSLASFGQLWAISHFLIVYSTYLGTILHFPIGKNGLFSALPFLLQFVVTQTSAFVSSYLQKKGIASVDTLRKMNTLFSGVGSAACLFGTYLAGCNRNLSIIFGIIAMGFCGMSFAGCFITPVDMSPQFAGSLNALALTAASLSSIILPLIVGYLTDEMQTIEQWNKVMFITIGVALATGIFFVIFGSAEVQPWNFVDETESKTVDKTRVKDDRKECEITRF